MAEIACHGAQNCLAVQRATNIRIYFTCELLTAGALSRLVKETLLFKGIRHLVSHHLREANLLLCKDMVRVGRVQTNGTDHFTAGQEWNDRQAPGAALSHP